MSEGAEIRFLSLFVPDLARAAELYARVFGRTPVVGDSDVPRPHPFSASEPVVFDFGGVKLALYQADMRATHPGDVGIGVQVDEELGEVAGRVTNGGGRVFFGPKRAACDGREMAVFVLPDRHFFEIVEPRH